MKIKNIDDKKCRPERVGISFSGGAERGIIHLGVIKAFIEFGMRPSYIVGVSVGSLIAAIYAYDPNNSDLIDFTIKIIKNLKPSDFGLSLSQIILRLLRQRLGLKSLGDLDGLGKILEGNLPIKDFKDAKVPFAIVATDRLTGQETWFDSGSVIDAIIASSSIPGIFPPLEFKNSLYVDGGVTDGLPLFKLAKEGCGTIFGINLGYAGEIVKPPKNLLENLLGSSNILSYQQERYEAKLIRALYPKIKIIEIKPQVAFDLPPFNFTADKIEPIVNEAYKFTKKFLKENKLV